MNNVKPCWWGPHFWYEMYAIAAVYPEKPDSKTQEAIKNYFSSLKLLLPCESCRKSYGIFSSEPDTNINDTNTFVSRNNLIEFIFNLRNKVNNKLQIEYCLTLVYTKKKLNKLICYDGNKIDGYISDLHETPYIQKRLQDKVFTFMKKKSKYNVDETKKIIAQCKEFIENPDFTLGSKKFKLYFKRNQNCTDIIKKIYHNMSYHDYCLAESFTRDQDLHLKLFYLGCSIIPESDLDKLLSGK